MEKYGLTPEVLVKVAEVGESYVGYLYFREILFFLPKIIVLIGIGYGIYRMAVIINKENG